MLRHVLCGCLLLSWLPFAAPVLAQANAQAGFVLGVPPVHSMRVLAERYEPLRAFLAARLGRPVYLASGADLADYHARTVRREFDLAIIPAHLARLAQQDAGFRPLAQFFPDHVAQLYTRDDRTLTHPGELRGQTLAVLDARALIVLATLEQLARQGLHAGRDFRLAVYRNHASAAQAVVSGEARAGVSNPHGMQQVPPELRARLRVHSSVPNVPAFVALAPPAAHSERAAPLQALLLEFAHSPAGQDFLRALAYEALRPAQEQSLRRVDIYLDLTRERL